MSRNLATSSCLECGYKVKLSDLSGKSIEFRRYSEYAPTMGCRFDCSCGTSYFAMYRRKDIFWGDIKLAFQDVIFGRKNKNYGKFVIKAAPTPAPGHPGESILWPAPNRPGYEETGVFTIDLSYYESFNDEQCNDEDIKQKILNKEEEPSYLCKDDAEDVEWIW